MFLASISSNVLNFQFVRSDTANLSTPLHTAAEPAVRAAVKN